MTISSASNGLRPGVVTSTNNPTNPYNGQVIYETDTGKTKVWNGAAWVMLTNSTTPPAMELIGGVTCSSGGTASNGVVTIGSAVSSVVIGNAYSSSYDNYRIVITGSTASSPGYNMYYKQNGSTGSTYNVFLTYAGYSANTLAGSNSPSNSVGIHIAISGTTVWGSSFDVFYPYATATTLLHGQGTSSSYVVYTNGFDNNAASSTGFSINAQAGSTITGGTIRVYGYRNSL